MENKNYEQELIKIKDYIKEKKYEKALDICNKKEYRDVEDIQAEKLFILTQKLDSYNTAYMTWIRFEASNNLNMVIRGIDILYHFKEYDKALEYANLHPSTDIRYIRNKLRLLVAMANREEIEKIMSDETYKSDEVCQRIVSKLKKKDTEKSDEEEKTNNEVSKLLTRIYLDDITKEEMEKSNVNSYQLSILLLAYYEKHNPKLGLHFVNKLTNLNTLPVDYRKTYNTIKQRLLAKKNKMFDITVYSKLLNTSIDPNLAIKHKKEENKTKEVKISVTDKAVIKEPVVEQKKYIKVVDNKMVSIVGNRINSRYNNTNSNNKTINMQKHTVLIKNVLSTELNEIGRYLYVMMQLPESRKNAIKAWDNLENMAYKPITDKETLRKLINIILKVSVEHPEIVDADSRKLVKLLEK